MGWVGTVRSRDMQPEIMDDPLLEARRHRQALRGLSRLNRLSRADRILWPAIDAVQTPDGRPR